MKAWEIIDGNKVVDVRKARTQTLKDGLYLFEGERKTHIQEELDKRSVADVMNS